LVSLVLFELALASYVCIGRGVREFVSTFRVLRGAAFERRDLAIVATTIAIIFLVEVASPSASSPRSELRTVAWIPTACLVACAEELVFRGYLLRQLRAMTG